MGWGPGSLILTPSQSGSSGRRKAKKKWRKDSPWVKPSRKRRKREPPRAKEPRGEEAPLLLGPLLQPPPGPQRVCTNTRSRMCSRTHARMYPRVQAPVSSHSHSLCLYVRSEWCGLLRPQ